MARSLAFVKFKKSLETEIRMFWHILVSLEYSSRWWDGVVEKPARLSLYPGDNMQPFNCIDVPVEDFLDGIEMTRSSTRENAIVSFVTAFEFYLLETMERMIYIDPSLIDNSSMPFEAKELASIAPTADVRRWLANKVADKYLRNKTHAEMIAKMDRFAKAGVKGALSSEIEEWGHWSLVRNSIVHTSRFATHELSLSWPSRFPHAGAKLSLTDREVRRVHHLALTIAEAIDSRVVETVIKDRDAEFIAREIFVQLGIDNPKEIRRKLAESALGNLSTAKIEKTLSRQRKGSFHDSWSINHGDLSKILR